MPDEALKIGDVVQLKSGGPKMTVTKVGDEEGVATVWVTWFDERNQTASTHFPAAAVLG